ncbi:MAG: hypothetical protein M1835_006274 [Candelina submexicana]|nr:MAG: hypothetical protein M1835_006274 [Candelina submexicana]
MPPLIEHEESSDGEDEVPFRDPKAPVKDEEDAMEDVKDEANEEDQDEDDAETGGDDEEKYVTGLASPLILEKKRRAY